MQNPYDQMVDTGQGGNPYDAMVAQEVSPITPDSPSSEINNPWYQNLAIGAGKGFSDIALGTQQRVAELASELGMDTQALQDRLSQQIMENRRAFNPLRKQSTAAGIGEFAGQALPTVTIPGGIAGGALMRTGTAALAGAGTGLLQPTTGNESAVGNATLGAILGGGVSSVLSGGGKILNAFGLKLPDTQGVRTTLGELTDNPTWKRLESISEQVPLIGLKNFRQKQLAEAETAAQRSMADYIVNPNAPDIVETNSAFVNKLYDKFRQVTSGKNITTEATTSHDAAFNLLDRYSKIFESLQDNKTKKILKNIVGDTTESTNVSPILGPQGEQIVNRVPATISVDDLWQARKGLWNAMQREYKQGNNEAYAVLAETRNAITQDLNNLSDKIAPGASQIFKDANEAYKRYNLKYEIMKEAYDKATRLTGDPTKFSPKLFSTQLYKIADQQGGRQLFSPTEISQLTGTANIMDMVKRAGQFHENPPTGNRFGLPIMAEMAGWKKIALTAPYYMVGKFLTTTESGKKLALAASKVEPSSRGMQVIMRMVYNQLPKISATGATRSY